MKPNITEGPWRFKFEKHPIPDAPVDATYHVWEIEQDSDAPLHVAHVDWVEGDDDQSEANAKAIVTAVNNTYHKGIDPEAVPDMIEALIEVRGYINTKREIFKMEYPEQEPGNINKKLKLIDEALTKAGVNLNAKAE